MNVLESPPIQMEYVILTDERFVGPVSNVDITELDKDEYGLVEIADPPYFHTILDQMGAEELYVLWRDDNTVSAPFTKAELKELSAESGIRRFHPCVYF